MVYRIFLIFSLFCIALLTSCASNQSIVNNVDEGEANEILVFLAANGIEAEKMKASGTAVGAAAAGGGPSGKWNIYVPEKDATKAMALLNKNGLPRKKGTNLLELFAKQGLMSSDKEETIRFQAGLAEQLKNTIRKMDGIIDADVQISFPLEAAAPGAAPTKITAAVYVKHLGILDDPNSHLETKIKRLVAGSINDLSYDNVAVISDRARLADVSYGYSEEAVSMKEQKKAMVKMWSVVMTKESLGHFRTLFFLLIFLILLFGGLCIYLAIKFYPQLMDKIPLIKKKKGK